MSLQAPVSSLTSPSLLPPLLLRLSSLSTSSIAFSSPPTTPILLLILLRRRNHQRRTTASTTSPAAATAADVVEVKLDSGLDVVKRFYEGVNRHDLESVEGLIAEDCVYEDLVFPKPFVGRKAIMEFFKKFNDSVSTELQFVIDDISDEDTAAVGVTWHLEWGGRPFPFSKGCSFYRLKVINGSRQITYARDSVEPAVKPGESVLVAIRGVAWLLRQFPQLADRL